MPHLCILHSKNLNKYDVGHTADILEERLRKHNSNHDSLERLTIGELMYTEIFLSKSKPMHANEKLKVGKEEKGPKY